MNIINLQEQCQLLNSWRIIKYLRRERLDSVFEINNIVEIILLILSSGSSWRAGLMYWESHDPGAIDFDKRPT